MKVILYKSKPWLQLFFIFCGAALLMAAYEFAKELENLGVNAVHAINTVPYDLIFPASRSPLRRVGGGGPHERYRRGDFDGRDRRPGRDHQSGLYLYF